jgi:ferredoxin
MKVTVDQDKCVSSGQCVLNASDVFGQRDDDGVVVLINDSPAAEQQKNARTAAAACPALAIDIEERRETPCPTP